MNHLSIHHRFSFRSAIACAALACLTLCSCRLTKPVSQHGTRTPIVMTAEQTVTKIRFVGDERSAPATQNANATPAATTKESPRFFPLPTRNPGFTMSSDTELSNSAPSSSAPSVSPTAKQTSASPHAGVVKATYITDATPDDGDGIAPPEPPVHYSMNQRDAGPANRWSIYGVDPRYPPQYPGAFTLPDAAYTGYPGDGYTVPGYVPRYMQGLPNPEVTIDDGGLTDPSVYDSDRRTPMDCDDSQTPLPNASCGPWKPPGISCPWPDDEYIFDGGDVDGSVKVRGDGTYEGLNAEDTVAHYETLSGHICVKPTNKVCIYAPRFAAVRQVTLAYGDKQLEKVGGVDMPICPVPQLDVQPVNTALQPVQPIGEIGQRAPITFIERTPPIGLTAHTVIRATVDRLKPYEDFALVRAGLLIEAEKPFIAQSVQSAIVWTIEQGVQVTVDGKKANVLDGDQRAQATFAYEPGKPCLRVCKLASTHSARPGEEVEFTIRFDNVGEQPVGNVTIVDNLTTRLELVEGSGQCSRDAKFYSEPNQVGSLVLHWEIKEPLNPGQGGIARFKCKVR